MSRVLLRLVAVLGTAALLVVATAGHDAPGGFRALVVVLPVVAVAVGIGLPSVVTTSVGLLGAAAVVAVPLTDRVVPASEAAVWAIAVAAVFDVSLRATCPPAPVHTGIGGRIRASTPLLVALATAPATAAVVVSFTEPGRPGPVWAVAALLVAGGLLAAVAASIVRHPADPEP